MGKKNKSGRKKSVDTGMLPYTWVKGDKHPTLEGRIFEQYTISNGKPYEVWLTEDYRNKQGERRRERDRIRWAATAHTRTPAINYNTGSEHGTYKMWEEHPIHKGMFFIQYVKKPDGSLKENWCNEKRKQKFMANIYEQSAKRRSIMECPDISKLDKSSIGEFYVLRDIKNKAHGKTVYHVDHIVPLAKGGIHHPSNLQLATAKWNQSKGAKIIK